MSTGAEYTSITPKKLLGYQDFKNTLLDYIRESVREQSERVWDVGCVHGTQLTLAADGADKFQITGTSLSSDGDGHIMDIDNAAENSGLQFENVVSVPYYVALKHNVRPVGIAINPRTGWPEYKTWQEEIGEKGEPDSVTDLGATLRFVVDSVTEAGVSNAGRKVLVYKNTAGKNATTEGVAIEVCTVVWSGGQNRIETAAQFGQETVSTTASDYTVMLLGPSVKRNTDLRLSPEHCFLGIITGAGAGNPPSSFDHYDQEIVTASLSKLNHITRVASNGRLKIDVKPIIGEDEEKQIIVRDTGGNIKFWIDEDGDTYIGGDLEVLGTTTQQDYVQVNASETITDNLTAGDDVGTDSHLIKGTWRQTDNAGTANFLYIDGVTGRIGINRTHSGSHRLAVNGESLFENRVDLEWGAPEIRMTETGVAYTAGGRWRTINDTGDWRLEENLAAAGDFSTNRYWLASDRTNTRMTTNSHLTPRANNTWDLGASGFEWRDLWVNRTAYIDEISLGVSPGEGLGSNMIPDSDVTRNIGSAAYRINKVFTRTLELSNVAGYGVSSDIVPTADNTYDIGSNSRRWANVYVYNLNFTGDFLPQFDNVQDLGSPTQRWAELHVSQLARFGSDGTFHTTYGTDSTLMVDNWKDRALDASDRLHSAYIEHDITTVAATPTGAWSSGLMIKAHSTHNANTHPWMAGLYSHTTHEGLGTVGWNDSIAVNVPGCIGGGTLSTGVGLGIYHAPATVGTYTKSYGIYIDPVDRGVQNWALYTLGGDHELGGLVKPHTDNAHDFGQALYRWKKLYMSDGVMIGNVTSPINPFHAGDPIGSRNNWNYVYANMADGTWDVATNFISRVDSLNGTHAAGSGVWNTYFGTEVAIAQNNSAGGWYATAHMDAKLTGTGSVDWIDSLSVRVAGTHGGGTLNSGVGIDISQPLAITGTLTNAYGLYISSQTRAVNNWAIRTAAGIVEFGDVVRPSADGTIDLGQAAREWRDLYLDGTAYIDTLSLSSAAGEGTEHLVPRLNNTYNLGSAAYRWSYLYADDIQGYYFRPWSTTDGYGVTAHWKPTTTNVYDLGSTGRTWRDVYASSIHFDAASSGFNNLFGGSTTGAVIFGNPSAHLEVALKNNDNNDAFGVTYSSANNGTGVNDTVAFKTGPIGTYSRSLYPLANNSFELGSSAARWSTIYGTNVNISGTSSLVNLDVTTSIDLTGGTFTMPTGAGQGFDSHLYPSANNTYDLGSATYQWRNAYFDGTVTCDYLSVASGAGEGSTNHFVPGTNNTYDLGGASYQWRDLYIDGTANLDAIAGCATAAITALTGVSTAAITTLTPGTTDGQGCAGHWKPTADDTYDLGGSAREWRDLFIDGTANIDTLALSTAAGEGVSTDIVPTSSGGALVLGNSSYEWYAYFAGLTSSSSISASSSSGYFNYVYANRLGSSGGTFVYLDNSGTTYISRGVYPTVDTNGSAQNPALGLSTNRWACGFGWGPWNNYTNYLLNRPNTTDAVGIHATVYNNTIKAKFLIVTNGTSNPTYYSNYKWNTATSGHATRTGVGLFRLYLDTALSSSYTAWIAHAMYPPYIAIAYNLATTYVDIYFYNSSFTRVDTTNMKVAVIAV